MKVFDKLVLYIYLFIYCSGGSLKNFVKQYGPLRDKQIIDFTFQLLRGLEYFHENNIVHHDIKGTFNTEVPV